MVKKPDRERVPAAPSPQAASAPEGLDVSRLMARRYLPNAVLLFAGVAFSESSEASLWVKCQCARMLTELAGATSATTPAAPQPHYGNGDARGPDA
ncbi:MAG: hypothetical protein FWD12_12245 [Alphaproteobacteria bacterium]|nr:hypothetical protein [Alphaproteobacteria bacterium]